MITDHEIVVLEDSGSCPYQITGKLHHAEKTFYFYFRSRHDESSVEIYKYIDDLEELDDSKCIFKDALFFRENERAGDINRKQAYYLLNFFIEEFRTTASK